MKLLLRFLIPFLSPFFFVVPLLNGQVIGLSHVATHYTDVFDEGAAETVAFDAGSGRLFFTNSDANELGILDISNPASPQEVATIPLGAYGGGVNSVDAHDGLVAVAVEAAAKTQPGAVVFFDTDGNFLNEVSVGALPDMLTFTNDGRRVLVANEGEPSDDYSIDPEGSVSIIDVSGGAGSATVATVTFGDYNDQKASLQNKGIRIFGPDATVAQDLEPEYITLTPDDRRAYAALQENNALAVIDVEAAQLLDIYSLTYKDYRSGAPTLTEYRLDQLEDWPVLGSPVYYGGQPPISLGGFSGIHFEPTESNDDTYVFYAIPDRGPIGAPVPKEHVVAFGSTESTPVDLLPLPLPEYQARIVKLRLDRTTGEVRLEDQTILRRFNEENNDTLVITGRPNIFFYDEIPVTYQDDETEYQSSDWVDTITNTTYSELGPKAYGANFGGITRDRDGYFWMSDNYRPSLYKFEPNGVLNKRYVPKGTAGLIDFFPLPAGFFGEEVLPKVYNKRRENHGFEAIAYDPDAHIVYAFLRTPMHNPDTTIQDNSDVIRILGVNAEDGTPVSEYVYLLERNRAPGLALSRVDMIGDAVYAGDGRILVIEQDASMPEDGPSSKKYVFEINLQGATNILGTALSDKEASKDPDDKTLEMMSADDLSAAGITPVHKRRAFNLPSAGYLPGAKVEGIALLPGGSLAVINDNDFGAAGGGASDIISLGIIDFDSTNKLDASDRDDRINIANYPIFGMLQPDAIAAFNVGGVNYIATANEGDAREYDGSPGFVEEARVQEIFLDPADFGDVDDLQQEAKLGRLLVTETLGDLDQDGLFDQLYAFGGRSFSIYDEYGNQVYDSHSSLETVTAFYNNGQYQNFFNSDNDDNDSFDSRSDAKGPEPEALAIGEVDGMRLAFIGLERIGGIMIFDISDPRAPAFVSYTNNRDFGVPAESREAGDLGVEDIAFIDGDDSPTGMPLLVTANEISGTVSIYSFGEVTDLETLADSGRSLRIYPNPAGQTLQTNAVSDFQVFSVAGQLLLIAQNTDRIGLQELPPGTYLIRDMVSRQTKLFVKQ